MMRSDWRDIVEWHELAVQVLAGETGTQAMIGGLAWAKEDERERMFTKAAEQNALIQERRQPVKQHQTKEEYLKKIAMLRGMQGLGGRIKFNGRL